MMQLHSKYCNIFSLPKSPYRGRINFMCKYLDFHLQITIPSGYGFILQWFQRRLKFIYNRRARDIECWQKFTWTLGSNELKRHLKKIEDAWGKIHFWFFTAVEPQYDFSGSCGSFSIYCGVGVVHYDERKFTVVVKNTTNIIKTNNHF